MVALAIIKKKIIIINHEGVDAYSQKEKKYEANKDQTVFVFC